MTLPANRREWPADALAEWEERAAMREYEGRQRRPDAERDAEADVRLAWGAVGTAASNPADRWRQIAMDLPKR